MCVCETLFLSFLSRRLFRFPIGVCLVQVQGAYVYLAGQQLTEEFFSTMQAHHSKEMIKKLFFQQKSLTCDILLADGSSLRSSFVSRGLSRRLVLFSNVSIQFPHRSIC